MGWIEQIRWHPGIGDPSIMGWVTVAAYALAALTCGLAARRAGRAPGSAGGSRGMWVLVTLMMAFLCLNKQLDLQSLATDLGRVLARKQGWYKERRDFQKWFVLGVLAVSFLTTCLLVFRYRTFWRRHFLLASGIAFLVTFIAVRAISFHHVDVLLKSRVGGMRMNWVLELTGIALIWLAAFRDCRNPLRTTSCIGAAAAL